MVGRRHRIRDETLLTGSTNVEGMLKVCLESMGMIHNIPTSAGPLGFPYHFRERLHNNRLHVNTTCNVRCGFAGAFLPSFRSFCLTYDTWITTVVRERTSQDSTKIGSNYTAFPVERNHSHIHTKSGLDQLSCFLCNLGKKRKM